MKMENRSRLKWNGLKRRETIEIGIERVPAEIPFESGGGGRVG